MPKTTMPRKRWRSDYDDEAPTRVETPLPTRYDPETRQYQIRDDEPAERSGAARS